MALVTPLLPAPCRRLILALLAAAFLAAAPSAQGFGFDDVDRMAKELASRPQPKPAFVLPKALKDLNYDQTRDIRFNPDHALWRADKLPFEIQFFHLGGYFEQPVRVHEIVGTEVRAVAFDPASFNYGANKIDPAALQKLGFAGFRIHFPLNTPRYKDELAVFLGASYFRVLGKGQRYGASARGLALDTAERGGEEFPRFEQFWIEKPARNAKQLVLYALLDSKRVTGAYRFVLKPGDETVADVQSKLYFREAVGKVGIAPVTSMYLYGENQPGNGEFFRPEVHDSDGLQIASANGEWIWRPLVNPKRLLTTSFTVPLARGFGLMQRDRTFGSYEDLEARYELRPSLWVEPTSNWGPGRVELVQIPTPDETHDNIVAYWVPAEAPKAGSSLTYSYRLLALKNTDKHPPTSWAAQSRRGRGYQPLPDDVVKFNVDFEGPALSQLPTGSDVDADLSLTNGVRQLLVVHPNEVRGGWRLVVQAKRTDKDKPMELRAHLRRGNEVLSETWSYIVPPP
ncbi:MAG TPA: glucan biosynthesis protein G [Burkholderiaceae bacterium]|nr:glucan biosynthesis protein G [Burkholderiaceae bacterium]